MDAHTRSLLTKAEAELIDSTTPAALAPLTHSELVALSHRVRKGADKYRDLYRRQGSATVRKAHSRAATSGANSGTAEKATVFADALSRVSARLAKLDREDAAQMRAERAAAEKPKKPKSAKR